MKKILFAFLILLNGSLLFSQSTRSNCPVKDETFTRSNPDGSLLTIHVSGSEMIHYFETTAGYTVLERQDGYFEYGRLNEFNDLVGSGIIAKDGISNVNKQLPTHLRYSPMQVSAFTQAFFQESQNTYKKAGGKPIYPKGRRNILTLLIQYPDLPATNQKSNFDSMMVKTDYNGTGSFRDYYLKSSYGQLDLAVDVFGWYNATSGYMNYGKSSPSYMTNVGNLVKRAVLAADSAGVDFTKYDNDSDGYVDGIIIMHSGIGAEEQSAPSANNYIWSHRYNLAYTVGAVNVDGKYVDAYGCFPEKRYNGGAYTQVGIGVLSHEFGHLMDLPDLYSTNDAGEGAGNYANMAGGPWLNSEKTPCLHDAWSRMAMGWINPTVITATGVYTIPKSLADSNFVFRVNTSRVNEYFLLENRQKKGFDKYIPSKGLAVWHINTNKARLLSVSGSNSVNTDTSAYGVGLEQADGRFDLEKGNNRGDGGDLYPGTTNNRSFNSYSKPNSSLQYKVGGVKQPSNIVLSNITQNPDSSITFSIGNRPTAGFDALPARGCAPLFVNFNNISAFANNYQWKFHDNTTSSNVQESKIYDSAGTYPVTLYVLDSANNVLDSTTQTIIVDASPIAGFTMTRGDSNTFIFKSTSKNATYITWRFGSNQSSMQPELSYQITGNADIPFMLIAFSSNQCTDTLSGIMSYWPLGLKENMSMMDLVAYPNPFQKELQIKFALSASREISIQLSDLMGNIIWKQEKMQFPGGANQMRIPVEGLANGVYLIEMRGEDFNKILRVSRQQD